MADSKFGTNDPRTQKKWSRRMFKWAVANMFLSKKGFLGSGQDAIIQVDKSLTEKGIGDKITFELLAPLTGEGIGDHGDMVGNSEQLVVQNFSVEVHERGHSVQSGGPLSELRTSTDIRKSGKSSLGLWTGQTLEDDVMRAEFGLYNVSGKRTVNEMPPLVGSDFDGTRHLIGGQNTAGSVIDLDQTVHTGLTAALTAQQVFGTQVISAAKVLAQTASTTKSKLRPVMVDGRLMFVMLIHPWQAWQLRQEAAWREAQQHANIRGEKNPIFSGAMGVWDGVVIHVYDRCPSRVGAGGATSAERWLEAADDATGESVLPNTVQAARAILLGAQAGVLGWGKSPGWRESEEDAGRKPVVGTDMIYAVAKTRFSEYETTDEDDSDVAGTNTEGSDFGLITVDTQIQTPF